MPSEDTQFKPGNQMWRRAYNPGRKKIYESAEKIWETACEYFKWVEENPYIDYKGAIIDGVPDTLQAPKMRPFTQEGLTIFMGISGDTYREYRHTAEFVEVISAIDNIIRDNKFSGATAGFFNANIVSRDLGLMDKQSTELSGPGGSPIEVDQDFVIEIVGAPQSLD